MATIQHAPDSAVSKSSSSSSSSAVVEMAALVPSVAASNNNESSIKASTKTTSPLTEWMNKRNQARIHYQDKARRRHAVACGNTSHDKCFSRGSRYTKDPNDNDIDSSMSLTIMRKTRIELMFQKMSSNPGSRKGMVFEPDPILPTNNIIRKKKKSGKGNQQEQPQPPQQQQPAQLHYKAEDVYVEVRVSLERTKDQQNPKRVKLALSVASVLRKELTSIYIAPRKQSSKLVLDVRVALASNGSRIGRFCGGELGIGCCKLALNWCMYHTNSTLIYRAARFYYEDSLNMGCNDVVSCFCLCSGWCSAPHRYLMKPQHAWQIVHAIGLLPGHNHPNLNTHPRVRTIYLGNFEDTGSGAIMCTEYTDHEHVEHIMHLLHDGEL